MLVPRDDKLHLSSHRLQQLHSIIVWHPLQRMAIDGDNLVIAFQPSIPWEEGEEEEEGEEGEEGKEGEEGEEERRGRKKRRGRRRGLKEWGGGRRGRGERIEEAEMATPQTVISLNLCKNRIKRVDSVAELGNYA